MKKLSIVCIIIFLVLQTHAQKYFTKNATISFEASTALEDVTAVNKSGTSVFNAATGQIEFAVLIKGFEFKKALMQEHFNENYMESSKYPKSVFKGKISNLSAINFQKPGAYPAKVTGVLEIHGVKKEVAASGTIKVSSQGVQILSKFPVTISDYKISIPGVVKDKVSSTAKISVNGNYSLLK